VDPLRDLLEQYQAYLYLLAIAAGLLLGLPASPGLTSMLELLVWPVLGVLLYVTFTQVPLVRLSTAIRDWRFLSALTLGNFVLLPALVWALLQLLPDDPAIRLGVLLVLLVPCTDWFIGFTHLGRGDGARAIAATPVLLLGQLLLLPLYLWLLLGDTAVELALGTHLLAAFAGLILVPLLLAWVTQWAAQYRTMPRALISWLAWLPVPLLAVVVMLIAASQAYMVLDMGPVFGKVLLVFVLFLLVAALLGKLLGRLFSLPPATARTLVFSFGTRNSFVMLPLALALPDPLRAAVVVIVFQSLVELFGMVAYVHWVPRRLIKSGPA